MLDIVLDEAVLGSLSFNGQRCTALKIMFVPSSHAEIVAKSLAERVERLPVGLPWQSWGDGLLSKITPLPNQNRIDYMRDLIDDATSKGAQIMNKDGGTISGGPESTLMVPAVLYPVTPDMKIYSEEQVRTLERFRLAFVPGCLRALVLCSFDLHSLVRLSLLHRMMRWRQFWNTVEMVNMVSRFPSLQLSKIPTLPPIYLTSFRQFLERSISTVNVGGHQTRCRSLVAEALQWASCQSEMRYSSFPRQLLSPTKTMA